MTIMRPIITVLAHNIRSTYNIGSLFRTAEGFGVHEIILSGYTPYPDLSLCVAAPTCALLEESASPVDPRLPHIRQKITQQIHKTALGAEAMVPFRYVAHIEQWLTENQQHDRLPVIALEQAPSSIMLPQFQPPRRYALLLGEEVHGVSPDILAQCDHIVEIPMYGQKESFNVSVAAGIALYAMTTA